MQAVVGNLFGALRQIVPGNDRPKTQPITSTGECAATVTAAQARMIGGAEYANEKPRSTMRPGLFVQMGCGSV